MREGSSESGCDAATHGQPNDIGLRPSNILKQKGKLVHIIRNGQSLLGDFRVTSAIDICDATPISDLRQKASQKRITVKKPLEPRFHNLIDDELEYQARGGQAMNEGNLCVK